REQNAVTHLHIQRAYLSVLQHLSVADGEHLTLDRLLLRRVGDDDAALRLLFLLHSLDDDAILQRPNLHGFFSLLVGLALQTGECQSARNVTGYGPLSRGFLTCLRIMPPPR